MSQIGSLRIALRITYADYTSSFEDLLARDGTVTVHDRNLRVLAIEICKISYDQSPIFIKNLVEEVDTKYFTRSSYNVEKDGNGNTLCTKKSNYRPQKTNTTSFSQQSFRWLGPKIWAQTPDQLKTIDSLPAIKNQVKKANFDNCFCNLCKEYIEGVGYIT